MNLGCVVLEGFLTCFMFIILLCVVHDMFLIVQFYHLLCVVYAMFYPVKLYHLHCVVFDR